MFAFTVGAIAGITTYITLSTARGEARLCRMLRHVSNCKCYRGGHSG